MEENKYKVLSKKKQKIDTSSGMIFGIDSETNERIYSSEKDEGNVIAIGMPGTGKTTSLVIPTLLKWKGRAFFIDISGDISKEIRYSRKGVYYYSPAEGIGLYDVFYEVDRKKTADEKLEQLLLIANLLIPETPGLAAGSNAKYYEDGGRSMLIASLIYFYANEFSFGKMCQEIAKLSPKELLEKIDSDSDIHNDVLPYLKYFEDANEANTQGCKQNLIRAIEGFYRSKKIVNSLRSISIEKGERGVTPPMLEKMDICVKIPQAELSKYQPLLRLMTGQMMNYYVSRKLDAKVPILMLLDEFGRFGQIPGIVDYLGTLRKYHIRVMMLTQNLSDLDLAYGRETRSSILGNCAIQVCLGTRDEIAQKYFAEQIGYKDRFKHDMSIGDRGTNYTTTTEKVYIIPPQDFSYLSVKGQLVILTPYGYMIASKRTWFDDKEFKETIEKSKKLAKQRQQKKNRR